jgi:hypothetical protein
MRHLSALPTWLPSLLLCRIIQLYAVFCYADHAVSCHVTTTHPHLVAPHPASQHTAHTKTSQLPCFVYAMDVPSPPGVLPAAYEIIQLQRSRVLLCCPHHIRIYVAPHNLPVTTLLRNTSQPSPPGVPPCCCVAPSSSSSVAVICCADEITFPSYSSGTTRSASQLLGATHRNTSQPSPPGVPACCVALGSTAFPQSNTAHHRDVSASFASYIQYIFLAHLVSLPAVSHHPAPA